MIILDRRLGIYVIINTPKVQTRNNRGIGTIFEHRPIIFLKYYNDCIKTKKIMQLMTFSFVCFPQT